MLSPLEEVKLPIPPKDFKKELTPTVITPASPKSGQSPSNARQSIYDSPTDSPEKILKSLVQINQEYKKDLAELQKAYATKIDQLQITLGISVDLKGIVSRGATESEAKVIANFRQGRERVANFTERNRELVRKLEKVKGSITKHEDKVLQLRGHYTNLLKGLHTEKEKLTGTLAALQENYKSIPLEKGNAIETERKQQLTQYNSKLMERTGDLFRSHAVIEEHLDAISDDQRMIDKCRNEAEGKLKVTLKKIGKERDTEMKNLQSQFEYLSEKQKSKQRSFLADAKRYCDAKKSKYAAINREIVKLKEIIAGQELVIKKAKQGEYSRGMTVLRSIPAHGTTKSLMCEDMKMKS